MFPKSACFLSLYALLLSACGGPPYTAPLVPGHDGPVYAGEPDAHEGETVVGMGRAAPPHASSPVYEDQDVPRTARRRPGLGTRFGESRYSRVNTAPFDRAAPQSPFSRTRVFYNDGSGLDEMMRSNRWRRHRSFPLAGGPFDLSIQSAQGRALPAFQMGGRRYVQGRASERYRIVVRNHSPARIEAVVSVDGRDVIDGSGASFDKRGYLIPPYGSVVIDGFRRSMRSVATFRFGAVDESYAARKSGSSRDVGVIGLALFHENGDSPFDWPTWRDEAHQRHGADPFPGRFATPPH